MKKAINIFAILFVAFNAVNSTKKVINFDDIVSSFTQINDPSLDGLAKINEISESFSESNKLLMAMENEINTNCDKIDVNAAAFLKGVDKKVSEFKDEIANIKTENDGIAVSLTENIKEQNEEVKKISEAKENIVKEREGITTKEEEIEEVIDVLHRLKNLAQDELAGKYKLETEMKNFTVVNKHGVSFIQRSNFKEELHSVMAKSEATGKSLISSLILMTSYDDGHYADPESIQKILDVLDKIIKKNEEKKGNLQTDYENNTKDYREIIDNSLELLESLKETAIKEEFNVSNNHKTSALYVRDIDFLENTKVRRESSKKFKNGICAKQKALCAANLKRYATSQTRLSEIKTQLA